MLGDARLEDGRGVETILHVGRSRAIPARIPKFCGVESFRRHSAIRGVGLSLVQLVGSVRLATTRDRSYKLNVLRRIGVEGLGRASIGDFALVSAVALSARRYP